MTDQQEPTPTPGELIGEIAALIQSLQAAGREIERLRAALREACRAAEVETTDHAIQIMEKALADG